MRTFPTLLGSALLSLVASTALAVPTAGAADSDDPRTWQTSDQVPGEIAPEVPRYLRGESSYEQVWGYQLRPGIWVAKWIHHTPRGAVRMFVIKADWAKDGVTLDYAHPDHVRRTRTLGHLLSHDDRAANVVAGINGDFFDIGDTGAPLGLGRARRGPAIHGIDFGWNSAFWIPRGGGAPKVDLLHLEAFIVDRPWRVTNVNSPQVKPKGIGIYNQRWGWAAGLRWTDGQRRFVRAVHVVGGKVVSNSRVFPTGEYDGYYLVSRGPEQTRQLSRLAVGSAVKVGYRLPNEPAMAITGNRIILKGGEVLTRDDTEMHPRTAIGVDRDNRKIVMVAVDGRSRRSRGYTMLELARMMRHMGSDDALNLDGGGSTTMILRRQGQLGVVNRPSDGQQREIANGLVLRYVPPRERRRR